MFNTYKVIIYVQMSFCFCNIHPLMMAQDRAESTRELINHGRFINLFPPDIINSVQRLERINTKKM